MGILDGKNILVTGVTMHTSIAYRVTEIAQAEGANVVVSNLGRAVGLTRRVVGRLETVPPVLELDVTDPEHLAALPGQLGEHFGDRVDGIVHSIAFANPERALGGAFLNTEWKDVGISLNTSTYSYVSLAVACRELLHRGSSIVGLTFDARVTWPNYDWTAVATAGPIDTIAKKAIPGAEEFNDIWGQRAPLGWDPTDTTATAKAVVALLSDWFPATTGEMIHVDGGLHSTGA